MHLTTLKVMKLGFRQMIALVPALLFSIIVPAQDLPKMPADPAVLSGVLPNGLSYYIASNASGKGLADFALVQKTGRGNTAFSDSIPGFAPDIAREALASLPRLGKESPQSFFIRHGSRPEAEGFVSVGDDATVYRFGNVRLSDGDAVLDSALIVLLNIADRGSFTDDRFSAEWYAPSDQAVVVAGDVDAKAVAASLKAMSYMIPSRQSLPRKDIYSPDTSGVSLRRTDVQAPLQNMSMYWTSRRVPREYMNTVQPAIFDMSIEMLGKIAVRRTRRALKAEGIPAADVSYARRGSNEGPWDDMFVLSVTAEERYADKIREIMSSVVTSIDTGGVTQGEYLLVESDFMTSLKEEAGFQISDNGEYIGRCISSFLYGSFLSSGKQLYAFHTARNLPDSVRCRLFNDVAAAMIHPFDSVSITEYQCDTLLDAPLALPGAGPKVKLRSSKREHLSGGTVWTFSNGFKVVYKKMPSDGRLYYTLALNGGYAGISGLKEGEGAYASDIFGLIGIAGRSGSDFFDALLKEGLVMEPRVTMSNTLISGSVPEDDAALLMRSLLAVANERTPSFEDFTYYAECQMAMLDNAVHSRDARMAAIDSIMCPGYRYSPYKSKGKLTSSFLSSFEKFLDVQMGKMNDGVLIIVGDMDEEALKQQLLVYVGGFRTNDNLARRTVVRYQPVSGWTTYTVKGQKDALDVAVSARIPLTSANYLAATVAMMALESELTEKLADSGMSFDVSHNFRIYPEERINLLVSVYGVDKEGMASGTAFRSPIEVLGSVREAMSGLDGKTIGENELKHYKAYLKHFLGLEMKDPRYWVDAITVRYLDGKDFTTGYAAAIDALTEADIKKVFSLIDKGSKVEYVTIK